MKRSGRIVVAVVAIGSMAPLQAQIRQAPAGTPAQIQARHQIMALEGVFENAVGLAGQLLHRHLQAGSVSNMVLLSGMARARGFRLDGYGVLFDVEFPSIRESIMWSMKALGRPDPEMLAAMAELRKNIQSVTDPQVRQEFERALRILEVQIRSTDPSAVARSRAEASAFTAGDVSRMALAQPATTDPRTVYMGHVSNALADAIVDHGGPLGIVADEWLAVAARESADRRFMPGEPSDTAMTLILRIKGSDLSALREQRLSREEARKRVEIKQY